MSIDDGAPHPRMRLTTEGFEELVARALDNLPDWVRERMENLAIIVEPWPTHDQRQKTGTNRGKLLLGLYEGLPLTQRGR